MFQILLFFHSIVRWLVLVSLGYTVGISLVKYIKDSPFTPTDNKWRHWTATISHIQLMIGMVMYFKSPAVAQFRAMGHVPETNIDEPFFFGLIHISMMILSIIIITIGSAISKRQQSDKKKFAIQLLFFGLALLIILAAIPWPFSPLAQRPIIRTF